MFKTVIINDKEVKLLSNAATPIFYKNVFGKDVLREVRSYYKDIDADAENTDAVLGITDLAGRLCFIMNKQAVCPSVQELMKLGDAEFIEWLADFDATAFLDGDTIKAVLAVWLDSQKTTSIAKKKSAKQ